MADLAKLKQEKEAVEERFFENAASEHLEKFDQQYDREAFEFLGRMNAVFSITTSLTSKLIEAVGTVEEKKYWRAWGYKSLADWLQNSQIVKDLSKSKYYREKKLLDYETAPVFDCFNDKKIPRKTRLLLAEGNAPIEYDGETIRIGDFSAPAGDGNAIIAIADAYNGAFQLLRDQNAAKDKKLESQDATIQKGSAENEQLRRALDDLNETPRFRRAVDELMSAFLNMVEAVGELDDAERDERAADDLKLVTHLYYTLSDAYGVKKALADTRELLAKVAAMKPVDEMTDEEKRETFLDRAAAELINDEEDFD